MSSEQRIAASRANGKKSRGPATPEGKANSSHNAERHGLLSGSIVLEGEDEERFNAMLARFISEYRPQTDSELVLVEAMAVWQFALQITRQVRVWGMETARLSEKIRNQESIVDRTASLNLLSRYAAASTRLFTRSRGELREGRAAEANFAKRT